MILSQKYLWVKYFYNYICKTFLVDNKFVENLKALRTEQKLSQEKLARAVGVTQQCVSEWERGRVEPTLTYLWRLADVFGVSMDVLCGRTEW